MINRNNADSQLDVIKDLSQVGDLSLYFNGSQLVFSAEQILAAIDTTPEFMDSFYSQVYGYPSAAQVCLSLLDSSTTPKRLMTTLNTDIVKKEADKHNQSSAESLTYEAIVGNTEVLNLVTYALGMFKVSVSSITTRKDRGFAFNITSTTLTDEEAKSLIGVISDFLTAYNASKPKAAKAADFTYVVQFTDKLNERLAVDYVPTSVKDSLPPVDGDVSTQDVKVADAPSNAAVPAPVSAPTAPQSASNANAPLVSMAPSTITNGAVTFAPAPFGFSVEGNSDRQVLYDLIVDGLKDTPEYSSCTTYDSYGLLSLVLYSKPGTFFFSETVLLLTQFLLLSTTGDYILRSDRSKGSITIKVKE